MCLCTRTCINDCLRRKEKSLEDLNQNVNLDIMNQIEADRRFTFFVRCEKKKKSMLNRTLFIFR